MIDGRSQLSLHIRVRQFNSHGLKFANFIPIPIWYKLQPNSVVRLLNAHFE